MKKVTSSVTKKGERWDFRVTVDGEFYASGSGPDFMSMASMAQGYVMSVADEADE